MTINAYINFRENCRQAIEGYSRGFEIKKTIIMTYGGTPPDPGYPMTIEL